PDGAANAVTDMRGQDAVVDIRRARIAAHGTGQTLPLLLLRLAPVALRVERLELLDHSIPAAAQRRELGIGVQSIVGDPRLARRPAPRVVDQPNGQIDRFVQLPAKEIAHGGKAPDRLWRTDLPMGVVVRPNRFLRPDAWEVDHA